MGKFLYSKNYPSEFKVLLINMENSFLTSRNPFTENEDLPLIVAAFPAVLGNAGWFRGKKLPEFENWQTTEEMMLRLAERAKMILNSKEEFYLLLDFALAKPSKDKEWDYRYLLSSVSPEDLKSCLKTALDEATECSKEFKKLPKSFSTFKQLADQYKEATDDGNFTAAKAFIDEFEELMTDQEGKTEIIPKPETIEEHSLRNSVKKLTQRLENFMQYVNCLISRIGWNVERSILNNNWTTKSGMYLGTHGQYVQLRRASKNIIKAYLELVGHLIPKIVPNSKVYKEATPQQVRGVCVMKDLQEVKSNQIKPKVADKPQVERQTKFTKDRKVIKKAMQQGEPISGPGLNVLAFLPKPAGAVVPRMTDADNMV